MTCRRQKKGVQLCYFGSLRHESRTSPPASGSTKKLHIVERVNPSVCQVEILRKIGGEEFRKKGTVAAVVADGVNLPKKKREWMGRETGRASGEADLKAFQKKREVSIQSSLL